MLDEQWMRKARKAGWRVTSKRGDLIELSCACSGCPGRLSIPKNNPGPVPKPCKRIHFGRLGQQSHELYHTLVDQLRDQRLSLDLSLEDVNAAAGFGDGHMNKLEALHRIAQIPTLQLWAQTLGLELTLVPAKLPRVTVRTMEQRLAPLKITPSQRQKKRANMSLQKHAT
jgi:transcriptional regulator with XRE-family HTH domain